LDTRPDAARPDRPDASAASGGDADAHIDAAVELHGRPDRPGRAVGRFRAGLVEVEPGPPRKPLWRRIAVWLLRWSATAAALFVLVSSALALLFNFVNPPPTVIMAQRALAGVDINRDWTPIERISPNLIDAVIAAEDTRFCQHDGFDVEELRRAVEEQGRRGYLRGASTVSQQTAKNVFLFNDGGFVRKGFEAWFTALIEGFWSKRRIMEVYLNVAEWGDGLFGAEAAAQARFGVSASELTRRQAALLAAVLPSPNRWRVDPPGPYVSRRASQVEARMGIVRRDGLADCVAEAA
jgi:monofunctional biosynthetic peptidoglycan transglycosylase